MDRATRAAHLQSSWEAATRSPVLFGKSFYARLFWVAPEVRGMFGSEPEAQEKKLTETLGFIITHADRLGSIKSEVRELALRHAGLGVRADHYAIVGEVLIWTLEHSLGPRFSFQEKQAWEELYTKLADMMIEAAHPKLA